MTITVGRFLATRHLGLTLGESRFSDGLVARFRVLCRDPVSVIRRGRPMSERSRSASSGTGVLQRRSRPDRDTCAGQSTNRFRVSSPADCAEGNGYEPRTWSD